jgi:hypothetical protein
VAKLSLRVLAIGEEIIVTQLDLSNRLLEATDLCPACVEKYPASRRAPLRDVAFPLPD